ncbi:hypothetical protein GCM10011613_11080 [Cellvibrio zantedeschiae]|uniref:Gamma-butyrobetaine hydroxylase-like N-terminal domain-containing protein n=1 Tax=Cellvibrio zantedeschiae TaxID=1237077 RepID=A0ABQ3AVI4_9GAMM|nr:DUF971 domain-containing protein [Cellvibrio zantedeschiae]GGY68622.1 hypothetical protein GCM10011613_11080 [Cellvibrio zantedeschiae]
MIFAPQKIHNAHLEQQLVICWRDGQEHRFSYGELRAACRCATCRAEQVRGHLVLRDADLKIKKINNLGQGLQFVFSDGHERGVYPWQYMYELGSRPL